MVDLSREELHRLARLGAKARLEDLRREEAAIRRAFPGLFGNTRQAQHGAHSSAAAHGRGASGGGRRSRMSAAARKAASERMKRYWAERKSKAAK